MHRRCGSATLSLLAFLGEKRPEFPIMREIPMGQYSYKKKNSSEFPLCYREKAMLMREAFTQNSGSVFTGPSESVDDGKLTRLIQWTEKIGLFNFAS